MSKTDYLRKRRRKETIFRAYGLAALGIAFLFLLLLITTIVGNGYSALFKTQILVNIDKDVSGGTKKILAESMRNEFTDANPRLILKLFGSSAHKNLKEAKANQIWLNSSDDIDLYYKGDKEVLTSDQARIIDNLIEKERIRKVFNTVFFTSADSREPEKAGFLGGILGSLMIIIVCLAISFPVGVASAVYLQEFAPKNRFTEFIEININNLAAVPSIIYGLLGLAVYINFMDLPRSAPYVGGMTLALMTLPVIIISSRAALRSVPDSIRQAAIGLGASPMQVVMHHSLPLAMPGVMTGTILGTARAIGETAPLLMIGMVAFTADIPTGFSSLSTAMPAQIYIWASSPETAFAAKTSLAIFVLIMILLVLNAVAIYLRRRFEIKW